MPASTAARTPHVLAYCHNVSGLGHIVRTSRIAARIVEHGARCTVITGCRALDDVAFDPRIAFVRLPAAQHAEIGFAAVDPELAGENVIALRGRLIADAVAAAGADVCLVDHHPLGLSGELVPALTRARGEGWPLFFVWGIPYGNGGLLWPTPPANPRLRQAVLHYRSAIAYGGEDLFDAVPAWALPAARLVAGLVGDEPLPRLPGRPRLIVASGGGGTTSLSLCEDVLRARRLVPGPLPPIRLFVGPLSAPEPIEALVAGEPDVDVIRAGDLRDVVRDAQVVVSRAGYNSAALLIRSDFPLVFVPHAGGSRDQVDRAAVLASQPGVRVVRPGPAHTGELADAIAAALDGPPSFPRAAAGNGADAAARWLIELASTAGV